MTTSRLERTVGDFGIDRELTSWALRQFLEAFEHRGRGRCSVEDFWLGYRAALIDLKVWSAFTTRPAEHGA